MIKSVKMQIRTIIDKKVAIIMLIVLSVMVLVNYFDNLRFFDGMPVDSLIDPMRILMLSVEDYNSASVKFVFLQFYPVLVILPAALSYASDRSNGTDIFIITDLIKRNIILVN